MARIAGVDLPKDKRIEIGLTYVYGIGRTSALKILEATGINPDTRVKDLTDEEESKLRECIDHGYIVEGDLRRQTALDIKRLTEIGCYRGLRHRRGLPVRGQRSKTNARTRKGPKRTIANMLTIRKKFVHAAESVRILKRARFISALLSITPWLPAPTQPEMPFPGLPPADSVSVAARNPLLSPRRLRRRRLQRLQWSMV